MDHQGLSSVGQKRIMVLPYQIRGPFLVFLQFAAIFTHLNISFTTARGHFWSKLCTDNGNYTDDSLYRKNLDTVLYNLKGTNNGYGFFNSSAGESRGGPDAAYAVALCGGHVGPDDCLRCVDNATRRLRQDCPYQREAAGWYDNCLLKYSNITLLHTLDGYRPGLHKWSSNVSELDDEFIKSVESLFPRLKEEAAKGGPLRKYAVGNTTYLYGLMQCTPDLSEEQCNQCLTESYQYCLNNSETILRKCYRPNCLLRYDVNPVSYGNGGDPSPPPDAPQPVSSDNGGDPSPPAEAPQPSPSPSGISSPPPDYGQSGISSPPSPAEQSSPPESSYISPPLPAEQSSPPESNPSPPAPPTSPSSPSEDDDKKNIITIVGSVVGAVGLGAIVSAVGYVFNLCGKRGGKGQNGEEGQQGVHYNTWNISLCPRLIDSGNKPGKDLPVRSNSVSE